MVDAIRKYRFKVGALAASRDDLFDRRLQRDERFLQRIESARKSLRAGLGTRLEDVKP
jgi:hypothetical protein